VFVALERITIKLGLEELGKLTMVFLYDDCRMPWHVHASPDRAECWGPRPRACISCGFPAEDRGTLSVHPGGWGRKER